MSEFHLEDGHQAVQVLHIDTVRSQKFFVKVNANPAEKAACQSLVRETFNKCCQDKGGNLEQWAGDGGFAFFSIKNPNSAVAAAVQFLSELDVLAEQVSTTLSNRVSAQECRREFRVKAHQCFIYYDEKTKMLGSSPEELDSFLKHESDLAAIGNEIFVTQQLLDRLDPTEKRNFERSTEQKTFGFLTTTIHRRKRHASERARDIFTPNLKPSDLTDKEWEYLKAHVKAQKINVAARNAITTALIKAASINHTRIDPDHLVSVTIESLYNYLRSVYVAQQFHLTLWVPSNDKLQLNKAAMHPKGRSIPRFIEPDRRYAAVQTFTTGAPVATRSVIGDRLEGKWLDFNPNPRKDVMRSALQLPVYRTTNRRGDPTVKDVMAVLSIDTDQVDFFLPEELAMWVDDLVGFLANFALAIASRPGKPPSWWKRKFGTWWPH